MGSEMCIRDRHKHITSSWSTLPYVHGRLPSGRNADGESNKNVGVKANTCNGPRDESGFLMQPHALRRHAVQKRTPIPCTSMSHISKRQRLDIARVYVPERGCVTPSAMQLQEMILDCVSSNPGVGENRVLERFWSYPACYIKSMLTAMAVNGRLLCCRLPQASRDLFTFSVSTQHQRSCFPVFK